MMAMTWYVTIGALLLSLAFITPLVKPLPLSVSTVYSGSGYCSVYYFTYAIDHGLGTADAERLTSIVLSIIAVSILIHGVSVTPLMNWYEGIARHKLERSRT